MSKDSAGTALPLTAFATLLLIAFMMAGNHVAARLAFNDGVDVATAVTFRSGVTALVVGLLAWQQRVSFALTARQRRMLLPIGGLVAVQSLCLYSSVARLPVALALLAFNTYPLWTAFWARAVYGHRTEPRVLRAMPVMLLGLALALDVFGAASGLGAAALGRGGEFGDHERRAHLRAGAGLGPARPGHRTGAGGWRFAGRGHCDVARLEAASAAVTRSSHDTESAR